MMLARIPETYQWMLVPVQANPQAAVTFQATRVSGSDALAVRASKKLKSEELLVTSLLWLTAPALGALGNRCGTAVHRG